jgi:hypothetical protein
MITTITTETTGRIDWRTGEPTVTRRERTQVEGTVTAVTATLPGVWTIDAGDQVATIRITGDWAVTADGTVRGLPQVGERVRILADAPRPTASHTDLVSAGATDAVIL